MMKMLKFPFAVVLLALTACAGKPQPPVTEYALSPPMQIRGMTEASSPLTLRLASVTASRIYQGPEFYYVDGNYRRNPYAWSRWVDAPVRMLRMVLQDGLEQSGLFRAVLPPSSRLRADLRLEITLYDFSHHLNDGQASQAVVRLGAHLLDARKGKLLASRRFEAGIPTAGDGAPAGVAGINAAVARILPDLLAWLRDSLGKAS